MAGCFDSVEKRGFEESSLSTRKRKGSLGKDLDVLLSATTITSSPLTPPQPTKTDTEENSAAATGLRQLPLEKLRRGKYQPRRDFEQARLLGLPAGHARGADGGMEWRRAVDGHSAF